jgi:hypothetical protein
VSLPPLEFCLGTSPILGEKSRPDRNALGSPMLATRAVANAGPIPGMASSRLLVFVRPMPCHDAAIECEDLGFHISASN